MSSGSGPSGETQYNWNQDMGPRWNSLLNTAPWLTGFQMNDQGNVVGLKPREQFTGERYAPATAEHHGARMNAWAMNDQSSSPLGAMNAARSGIEDTLGGDYLGRNPYALGGDNPYVTGNQFMDQATSTDRNMFAGDSPYFRTALTNGMEDITSAFQKGTAADTTRMFNLAGAFGGSAHQDKMANDESVLGKTLTNYASGMINDQFNRSAGLEDAFLGRDIQNQQANASRMSGLREAELGRGFQNYNTGLDRGFQGYENERNRMMNAIGAGQNEQGLAYQRNNELMNMGSFFQGLDQQNRDFQFDQWNQTMNYPWTALQGLAGLYGQAMGGGAGLTRSVYEGGGSSAAPWLGAALGAASLFG